MQNKPNLPDAQMKVSSVLTKDYENDNTFRLPENKPKQTQYEPNQTQYKPNSRKAKMSVTSILAKDYENKPRLPAPPKQTQYKPNQTQPVASLPVVSLGVYPECNRREGVEPISNRIPMLLCGALLSPMDS